MKRRTLLVGTGTLATTALAGCLGTGESDDTNTGDDDNSTNTDDENSSSTESRTISVQESSEVDAEPDLAVFQTEVLETGDNPEVVQESLAERSDSVYDALIEYGIDEDDVVTGQFDISQQVDYRRLEEAEREPETEEDLEEYTYYEGTHSFTVRVHQVEDVGNVIDTAIRAGADEIGRINFTLSDERQEELREQALQDALESARTEADFVANEVDATVVEEKQIDTSGGGFTPVRERYELDEVDEVVEDDAAPATELRPDDVTVTARVSVLYRIE